MNVLLETWDTPFGLPPFARVRDEDFSPAFDEALSRARAAVAAIADGPAADFAGVIDALAKGRADASPMLTQIIGFGELPAAFEALRKPTDQCKLLIDPHRAG